MRILLACLAALGLAHPAASQWARQEGGTKARLRGVSAAGPAVAWAGGAGGTCLRTVDGGLTWARVAVPDSSALDFRDVQALDDRAACLLSIGPGDLSRVYRTPDGGASWTLAYRATDPKVFLDAIAFWDPEHGLALGDPVDGRFAILATEDGGRTWARLPGAGMPEALPGEGAFAASGTCLAVQGESNAWFGTGGGATARVFRSTDWGRSWAAAPTPIRSGNPSSGVFSVAFRDPEHGVAVGGDYRAPGDPAGNLATTEDGGRTWIPAGASRPLGYRSAVAIVPGAAGPTLVVVGPSGSDRSTDGGRTWSSLGVEGFHAVGFGGTGPAGWAVGEDGRIARFEPAEGQGRAPGSAPSATGTSPSFPQSDQPR